MVEIKRSDDIGSSASTSWLHLIFSLTIRWNMKLNTIPMATAMKTRFCKRIKLKNSCDSLFVCLMMLNVTFNNISVISWRSVLLVEDTGGPGENHRPVASHWQTLSHNAVHLSLIEIWTHNVRGDRHWLHS